MSEKINWTLSVQVVAGPTVTASNAITVDAYDKIGVAVAANDTKTIEVQPGDAGRVQFLLIHSDHFDDALTFKVAGTTTDIPLDAPIMLMGDGAVGLLGASPESLDIANGTSQDPVNIEVIVGRRAIA